MVDEPTQEPLLDDASGPSRGVVVAATIVGVLAVLGLAWAAASWLLGDGPDQVAIDPLPSVNTQTPDPVSWPPT